MLVDENYPTYKWLKCLDILLALGFTEEEIKKALDDVGHTTESLTNVNFHQHEPYTARESVKTPCVFIRKCHGTITERKMMFGKEWTSTSCVPGAEYREPAQYQGLKHGILLKQLLTNRLPWFPEFDWDAYEIHGYGDNPVKHLEIYMKTSAGSLYVPVIALLWKEPQRITERMTSYFKDYRLTSSYSLNKKKDESFEAFQERKQQEYQKDLGPLETEEAKKLFEYLKGDN